MDKGEDLMFGNKYKKAYNAIAPSQELVLETIKRAKAEKNGDEKKTRKNGFVQKLAFVTVAITVCFVTAIPVCAAYIPAFYKIVEFVSPVLADQLVPIEKSSTSQGITMQVEAINLVGNQADIIISLQDAENSKQDLVHGTMDLYDSYGLSDYTNNSVIGGCHFLTYDAVEDKAYFQVTVQSDKVYQADKMQFQVRSVLCNKYEETKGVDLSGIVDTANTKWVTLSGSGGILSEEELPDSLRGDSDTAEDLPRTKVLDELKVADCAADDFTVTGIAYMDGVLRVQMCMGDNWRSDRHVQLFLQDSNGNERYSDHSVSWNEEIGDTSYQFYEFWYIEDIAEIEAYSMYGIFHDSGELIEGNWTVTFRVGD